MSTDQQLPLQALLLTVDHISHRISSEKKPVGTLHLYADRIEWNEHEKSPTLAVSLCDVDRQRISRSPKSVAIQFVLRNASSISFNFVNPNRTREQLLAERDVLVELLQELLAQQGATVSNLISQVEESTPKKEQLLTESKHLQDLYRHLVLTKLMKPEVFWCDHLKEDEKMKEGEVGVSGSFLSSLPQVEGTNGLKLNLTQEAINSIFKTFPSVEKRYNELVPKTYTKEQFWEKFFHSYYFNRDRPVGSSASEKNDPFLPCIQSDDADMERILLKAYVKKTLDKNSLQDDLGILTAQEDDQVDNKRDSHKSLLIRRCNYQSGRILQTALGDRWDKLLKGNASESSISVKASLFDEDKPGCSNLNVNESSKSVLDDEDIVVDGEMLVPDNTDMERYLAGVDLNTAANITEKTLPKEEAERIRSLMLRINKRKHTTDHLERFKAVMESGKDPFHIPKGKLKSKAEMDKPRLPADLNRNQLVELMAVNDSCYELVKHFWDVFPPLSADMEKTLKERVETLKKYRSATLVPLQAEYGAHNMEAIIELIDNALTYYQKYTIKKKRPKQ
uniref:BSD domain-containing protein n=1 Tax=Steinernema glaseri TaxID=37863 RepID=A0A1I7YZF9_9BILA